MTRHRWLLATAAGASLALTLGHGWVHASVPVPLASWQYGVVGVVLVLAPIVGTGAVLRGRQTVGHWTLVLGGLAAAIFELLFHFIVRNPDHVAAVGDGHMAFPITAALSVAGDLLPVVVVGLYWQTASDAHATTPFSFGD